MLGELRKFYVENAVPMKRTRVRVSELTAGRVVEADFRLLSQRSGAPCRAGCHARAGRRSFGPRSGMQEFEHRASATWRGKLVRRDTSEHRSWGVGASDLTRQAAPRASQRGREAIFVAVSPEEPK